MDEEPIKIGLKPGSQNICMAWRDKNGKIQKKEDKTCVWYPKTLLQKKTNSEPLVGKEASIKSESEWPLNLGLVEKESGFNQIKDIFRKFDIPQESDMVIASPAMEINRGKMLLSKAVDEVCNPKRMWMLSEAMCSAVYILKDPNKIKEGTYLVANLGSSTFEFGCFHETQIVHLSAHSEVSGNNVDRKVLTKIQNSVGDAMITERDVREIKEQASLVVPKDFIIKGQNRDGIVEIEVCNEVIEPIKEYANLVCEVIKRELKIIDPQIRKSALENPLIISGGMSNIEGLSQLITEILKEKLNYPVETLYTNDMSNHVAPAIGALLLCEEIVKEEST